MVRLAFVRVNDPDVGTFVGAADMATGRVFDVSAAVGTDLLPVVASGEINSPLLHERLNTQIDGTTPYTESLDTLLAGTGRGRLLLPYLPPEIWGVGVSYRRAAELHEEDLSSHARAGGLYDYVFNSTRPEIFFKGLPRHAAGHLAFIGVRGDSHGTMIEAELAAVFDAGGAIVAYTIANDVTAWDLERECPLFLCYAKIFDGSCGIGPCLVPAAFVAQPRNLAVTCHIERKGALLYTAHGSTSGMKRTLEEMSAYLLDYNRAPGGTLLCTGTAVGIPNDLHIEDGDVVSIEIEGLGRLVNTARRLTNRGESQ